MSDAIVIQPFLSGIFAILGSLITGITLLRVAEKTQKHALVLEQRRARLAKGEELVAVLSELSSWRARDDQQLLTEIAQIEAKLNRAYALAITYFGDDGRVATIFYDQGREVMEKLNESAEDYSGGSPPMDLNATNFMYAVFQASTRNLTGWVLEEMRRMNARSAAI